MGDTFAERFGTWPPSAPGADLTVYQAGERGGAYGPYDYAPARADAFTDRFGNWGVANPYVGGEGRGIAAGGLYEAPGGFPADRFGDWQSYERGGMQLTGPADWTPPFARTETLVPPSDTRVSPSDTRVPPSDAVPTDRPPYDRQPVYAPPPSPAPAAPTSPGRMTDEQVRQAAEGPAVTIANQAVSVMQIGAALLRAQQPSYFTPPGDIGPTQAVMAVQKLRMLAMSGDPKAMTQLQLLDQIMQRQSPNPTTM